MSEKLRDVMGKIRWYVRQLSGDAAYENYLRHARAGNCAATAVLTREEFYLDSLRRRYSGVSRCC